MLLAEKELLHSDVLMYLTVGRGILNGKKMYIDLFESKPPFIFLLSALSLWNGGTFLMRVVQALNLLSLPVAFGWFFRKDKIRMMTGILFGGLLALWCERSSGGLQTEIFGILPVVLYVLNIQFPSTNKRMILSGFCIAFAVMVKEPYILGIFVAAVLTSRTLLEFAQRFIYPSILAGIAVTAFLCVLGVFPVYVGTYIPAMLQSRIQDAGPLYLRALWVQRLFTSLTEFSSVPLLGYFLFLLWVLYLKDWRIMIMGVLGVLGMGRLFVLFTLLHKTSLLGVGAWATLTDPGFLWISVLYLLGTVGYIIALYWFHSWRLFRAFLVLPFLCVAIGIGGYEPNYMLFILPAILALFIQIRWEYSVLVALMVLLYVRPVMTDTRAATLEQESLQTSQQLDALMDACRYDEYVFDGQKIPGFARHSPVGPLFITSVHGYLGKNPLFDQTTENSRNAKIVLKEGNGPISFAPSCASGFSIPGYSLKFQ